MNVYCKKGFNMSTTYTTEALDLIIEDLTTQPNVIIDEKKQQRVILSRSTVKNPKVTSDSDRCRGIDVKRLPGGGTIRVTLEQCRLGFEKCTKHHNDQLFHFGTKKVPLGLMIPLNNMVSFLVALADAGAAAGAAAAADHIKEADAKAADAGAAAGAAAADDYIKKAQRKLLMMMRRYHLKTDINY